MAQTKKTMTLNLTQAEMDALELLCDQKDMSKTAVMRQALRLYQMIDVRIRNGEQLFYENDKMLKSELIIL